jgi:hypothetical protein
MTADGPDGVLRLAAGPLEVALWEDYTYTPGSADNVYAYDREVVFDTQMCRAVGVRVSEGGRVLGSMVMLVTVGCGGPREGSVVTREGVLYLPGADEVCAFDLPSLRLLWQARTHAGCVFGLHEIPGSDALIVHGEITVARLSADGYVEWEEGGRDIFTGPLRIDGDAAEVTDWNEDLYRFRLSDGRMLAGPTPTAAHEPPRSAGWVDRIAGWFR